MRTPENRSGRITERIMATVKTKLPKLTTHEYNRVYESVYSVLHEEIEPANIEPCKMLPDDFLKNHKF